MSVLVYVDHADGQVKKTSLEAISYGYAISQQLGVKLIAVCFGQLQHDAADLGNYGVQEVYHYNHESYNSFDGQSRSKAISEVATQQQATVVVCSQNQNGKNIAPRVAVQLKAGIVTGVVALPNISNNQFIVKKVVFSGKAFAHVNISSACKIIGLNPNSYSIQQQPQTATVHQVNTAAQPKIKVVSTQKLSGEISLTEADIVVSGGRGLKGPEHWGILEDLAKTLHAATACSRPVADAHWRPHHEHVGQTGFQVAPNLYIAIGISGAIQHLAGVNRSKTIVVINKDAEAPFFKVADYGIVGDAFEVLPQLTQAIQALK